jgi:hypothetical protein
VPKRQLQPTGIKAGGVTSPNNRREGILGRLERRLLLESERAAGGGCLCRFDRHRIKTLSEGSRLCSRIDSALTHHGKRRMGAEPFTVPRQTSLKVRTAATPQVVPITLVTRDDLPLDLKCLRTACLHELAPAPCLRWGDKLEQPQTPVQCRGGNLDERTT